MKLVMSIAVLLVVIIGGGFLFWQKLKIEKKDFVLKSKMIKVHDGIVILGIQTEAKTVGEFLEQQKLQLKSEDIIYPDKNVKIDGGMTLTISRAIPILIKVDGQELKKNVQVETVQDALRECQIHLSPSDKVVPSLESFLSDNLEIVVTRIDHKEVSEMEMIDYKTVEEKDGRLKWRTKKTKQKGEKGKKEVKYLVTYKNGKEVERKKVKTTIIKEPKDKIIVTGTKIKIGKTQRGKASWYAYTGKMAAASIAFPKGTWLRITAVNSKKQIFVVINDYGPAAYTGKILDLDKVAFEKLAPLGAGVIEVKIEEIK